MAAGNTDALSDCVALSCQIPLSVEELFVDFVTQRLASAIETLDSPRDGFALIRFYVDPAKASSASVEIDIFCREQLQLADPVAVETATVRDRDWQEEFRCSVRPALIDGSILLRPSWMGSDDPRCHQARAGADPEFEIVIDPKMAFGTGSHETTRLCLKALNRELTAGQRLADIGCGSGILAIFAALKGASEALAVDIDPVAIENCRENVAFNGVEKSVTIHTGSVDLLLSSEKFDFVVANILFHKLRLLLPNIISILAPNAILALAGMLVTDAPEVGNTLKELGVSEWSREDDGEWSLYLCRISGA